MRVAWVLHSWPEPDMRLREVARALAGAGTELVVIASTVSEFAHDERGAGPDSFADVGSVRRIARTDIHREHWQRSASTSVAAEFAEILAAERPDVVHVHDWRGLSRDLVHAAALAGRPAVVSLRDSWSTCLIQTRIQPATQAACDVPLAAHPCLACAQRVPPRTPWVPIEAQHMAFALHRADILRELDLSRGILVRDRAHGVAIRTFLGDEGARLRPFIEWDANAHEIRTLLDTYSVAAAAGAPRVARPSPDDWFTMRMRAFADAEWDRCAQATAASTHAPPGSAPGESA